MLHIEHPQLQAEVTLKIAVFHRPPSAHFMIDPIISSFIDCHNPN